MNKIITGMTAILLIGTSVTNFGTAAINIMTISDITKVSADETDDPDTTSEIIKCGNDAYCTITDNGSTMIITGKGRIDYIPYDGRNVKKLIVESGITGIYYQVFSKYENLESISLPDSINNIDSEVFENTAWYKNQPDGLVYACNIAYNYKGKMKENTDIIFKEGTTGIAEKAFYECSEIKSVTFPDSITKIPYSSFYKCENLTSVTIPDSVTDIGAYAFFSCSSLEKVIIPDSVTDIGSSAFGDCFMLVDITFPDSIPSLGQHVFDCTLWYNNQPLGIVYANNTVCGYKYETTDYTDIEIKEGTKSIADGAFADCTYIKSVNIPDSVINTGYSIFEGCTSLENIVFSDSMTSVNGSSFWNCSSLKSVTFPQNIKCIGSSAFHQNNELESVTFLSEELEIKYDAFGDVPNLRDVFYVGSEEDWKQKVKIALDNEKLTDARFHFNYSPSSENTDIVPDGHVSADNNDIIYGDLNKDKIIDLNDLTNLSRFLLGDTVLDENSVKAADVSYDGIIDILDLVVLKQYICHDNVKLGPKI